MLQVRDMTVYFGGDSLLIPELREVRERFPSIQLALLAVNGLHAVGKQVVMNDEEAAELAGILRAEVAVPTHYAFRGSWFTDTFILSRHGTPQGFARAARTAAPDTKVRILPPGQTPPWWSHWMSCAPLAFEAPYTSRALPLCLAKMEAGSDSSTRASSDAAMVDGGSSSARSSLSRSAGSSSAHAVMPTHSPTPARPM